MVKFYASVAGTCVIQQRCAPKRPAEYDGCISVLYQTDETNLSELSEKLRAYGEVIGEGELVPSFAPGKREVHFQLATHEQAEQAITGLAGLSGTLTPLTILKPLWKPLGLEIKGDTGPSTVSALAADGLALGVLSLGDVILSVNGTLVKGSAHAMTLLENAGGEVCICTQLAPQEEVTVTKPFLGVTLEGDFAPPVVSALAPDGLASSVLSVGDVILSVDGTEVNGHAQATALLKNAVGAVKIRVRRAPTESTITIDKPSTRLGVTLNGDHGPPTVSALAPDGLAFGELAVGDVLLSVNGTTVNGHAHGTALLRMARDEVVLTIHRGGAQTRVVITKPPAELGVVLRAHMYTLEGDTEPPVVSALAPDGLAVSALSVGDMILSVNGTIVEGCDQTRALLREAEVAWQPAAMSQTPEEELLKWSLRLSAVLSLTLVGLPPFMVASRLEAERISTCQMTFGRDLHFAALWLWAVSSMFLVLMFLGHIVESIVCHTYCNYGHCHYGPVDPSGRDWYSHSSCEGAWWSIPIFVIPFLVSIATAFCFTNLAERLRVATSLREQDRTSSPRLPPPSPAPPSPPPSPSPTLLAPIANVGDELTICVRRAPEDEVIVAKPRFGMTLKGDRGPPIVSNVASDGLAFGTLAVGDMILSVNGTNVDGHAQATALIKDAVREVKICKCPISTHTITRAFMGVTLEGDHGAPVVTALAADGLAFGKMAVGDVLVSVNSTLVNDHKHGTALLNASPSEVALIVRRESSSEAITAIPVYNDRSYDDDKDGRGWTIFEQGVALTSAAHLARAKEQGELPERFAKAIVARPKLIDITGEEPVSRDADVEDADPNVVLDGAVRAALASSWMGNKEKVREMLYEFEWLIATAIKSAAVDALSVTTDPRIRGTTVTIFKPRGLVGVALSDDIGSPIVDAVASDGLAYGALFVGDVIISVNGTTANDSAQVIALLEEAEGSVQVCARRLGEESTVTIDKPLTRLGVTLNGDHGPPTVSALAPDGLAFGELAVGDVLLSVNGTTVNGHAHGTALLKAAEGKVALVVRRKGTAQPRVSPADAEPLAPPPAETSPTQLKHPASFSSRATKFDASLRKLVAPSRLPSPGTATATPEDVQKSRRSHKHGEGTNEHATKEAPPFLLRKLKTTPPQGRERAREYGGSASTSEGMHSMSDFEV